MNETTAATPDQKEIKVPKFLVGDLRHMSDHGLTTQFACPKKQAYYLSIRKDGITRIEAGDSHIILHTIGRVTFTDLYLAQGGYKIRHAHYMDEAANLRFTIKRDGDQDEVAHDVLKAVILGRDMPNQFRSARSHGSVQDTHRSWLKSFAWTLAGEAGMRAKALEGLRAGIKSEINSIDYNLRQKSYEIGRFDSRNFDEEIVSARKRAKSTIEHNNKKEAAIRNAYTKAEEEDFSEGWEKKCDVGGSYYNAPEHLRLLGMTRRDPYGQVMRLVMPAVSCMMNYPVHSANYTATRDGDTIRLSSGIVCEVTASRALAWIKGEAEAPNTRYGLCSKIEASTPGGLAIILVKCGCHYLDLRNLGEDFAAALVPTHTVTIASGKPEIVWSAAFKSACLERMKESHDESLKWFESNKREAAREFFELRKSLIGLRDNKSLHMDRMQQEEKALEEAKAVKEEELENHPLLKLSSSLAQVNTAMIAASNALCGIEA